MNYESNDGEKAARQSSNTSALNLGAIGKFAEPVERTWHESDCMLYALSIGLGYPDYTHDLEYTTENTDGVTLRTIPTFASIVGRNQEAEWLAFPPSPGDTFLASEEIALTRNIPTAGHLRVHTKVGNIFDKRSGALLEMLSSAEDTDGGGILFTRRWTVFIRGAGGYGGDRGPSVPKLTGFTPEAVIHCETNPIGALLYRLLDGRSQIHSDPKLALNRGFKRPIMHGRATLGYACQLLMKAFPPKPNQRVAGISGYFQRPLLPGARIRLEVARKSANVLIFQVLNESGELVVSAGEYQLEDGST